MAAGATLLPAEQTWQAAERTGWPGWLFWPLVVVTLGLSVLNTAARMTRDETGQRAVRTEG